jgi:hypothetical protein
MIKKIIKWLTEEDDLSLFILKILVVVQTSIVLAVIIKIVKAMWGVKAIKYE